MMLRALVLLLLLPPMLLPPGMCICQFVPAENVPASPIAAAPKSVAAHAGARPDCPCESCRERAASVSRDEGDGPRTPDDATPRPGPAKHWPGCPAAVGAVPLTVVMATVAVPADFAAAVGFFAPTSAVGVPCARTAPVPPPTCSTPLYLSHCTLLI